MCMHTPVPPPAAQLLRELLVIMSTQNHRLHTAAKAFGEGLDIWEKFCHMPYGCVPTAGKAVLHKEVL